MEMYNRNKHERGTWNMESRTIKEKKEEVCQEEGWEKKTTSRNSERR